MTRAVPFHDQDLLDILEGRVRAKCPVCHCDICLTTRDRLWTHGPLRARCRGSQRTLPGARWAARTVRGRPVVDVPTGAVL